MNRTPSVALLSLRSVRRVPYYGAVVEAEDVLAECLGARVHTVESASGVLSHPRLVSPRRRRVIAATGMLRPYRVDPHPRDVPRADLLVVLVNDIHDLAMAMAAGVWDRLGEEVVVHVNEVGFRELKVHWDSIWRMQRRVDHLFCGFDAVPLGRLRRGRVRTVSQVSGMVDVLSFPERSHVDRPVDVLNFGRRDPAQHELIRRWAHSSGGRYDHDTEPVTAVESVEGHRRQFVERATLARVMITNFARFDEPGRTRGHRTVGLRYWEAMAAGCALAGEHPVESELYRSAAAPIGPLEFSVGASSLPGDLIAALEDPAVSEQLGQRGRWAALRHHDVAHRWHQMATLAGLPVAPAIEARIAALQSRVAQAEAS